MVLVAATPEITGGVVSGVGVGVTVGVGVEVGVGVDVGGVVVPNCWSIPGGNGFLHSGTKNSPLECLLSQPGAIKWPKAHGFFLPLSSSSNTIGLFTKSIRSRVSVSGPTLPT